MLTPKRTGEIALALYWLMNGQGGEFKAYDGNEKTSQIYFEFIVKIERSALLSFDDLIAMPPGLGREINLEEKGQIAYAVLKYEIMFGKFKPHEWAPPVLHDLAMLVEADPVEFKIFVEGMHADTLREMQLMAAFA